MEIYYITIALLAIAAIFYTLSLRTPIYIDDRISLNNERVRNRYLFFSLLVIVSVIGLRNSSVGADTYAYMLEYNASKNATITGMYFSIKREIGYSLLNLSFSKLNIPWQVFLVLISLFIVAVFISFIRENCLLSFFPLFLYITIGNFAVNMTALRQSIALSLCLIAYKKATQSKYIAFSILVVLAASIHYTALIFAIVYFLTKFDFKKKRQLLKWLFLPALVRIGSGVFYQILDLFALDKYRGNGYFSDVNLSLNILAELVPITILVGGFILLAIRQEKDISQKEYHFFIFTSLYVCMYELTHAVYMAGRLSYYFSPFVIVLSANLIRKISDKRIRFVVYCFTYLLCILFFIISIPGSSYNIDNYCFFWNGGR